MLTPLAHETLRLFGEEGMEVPAIADATGQPWLTVRNLINVHADGHRTKAKRLLDEQKAPSREEVDKAIAEVKAKQPSGPLVEPIAKPKPPATVKEKIAVIANVVRDDAAPYDPHALAAIHVAEEAAGMRPFEVPTDDLITIDATLAVARAHHNPLTREQAEDITERAAQLRQQIIGERRRDMALARIADLEAEIARLREVAAA